MYFRGSRAGRGSAPNVTGMAPRTDEVFAPLLADPRELQFALRLAFLHNNATAAEVAVGHYYGIYRWALPKHNGAVQLNIGGGIFPLFNFSQNRDLQVIDFYANLPLDVRIGKWSGRFMLYHVSSHLGDDYIRANNLTSSEIPPQNSWNSLRSILSYDIKPALRVYGGYTYNILAYPADVQKTQAFQSGFEITSHVINNPHAQAYWANDIQWWERTTYKAQFNSQVGVKIGRKPTYGRGISYFFEFTAGPEYYGQFFEREETRIGIGAKFDID